MFWTNLIIELNVFEMLRQDLKPQQCDLANIKISI